MQERRGHWCHARLQCVAAAEACQFTSSPALEQRRRRQRSHARMMPRLILAASRVTCAPWSR